MDEDNIDFGKEWSAVLVDGTIDFDRGWTIIEKGISRVLKGHMDPELNYCSILYSFIYDMCTRYPEDYPEKLFNKYVELLKECIHSTVIPPSGEKLGELFLQEFLERFNDYNVMVVNPLCAVFGYVEESLCQSRKIFVPVISPPKLHEVSLTCFQKLVLDEKFDEKLRVTTLDMIDQERDGKNINQSLVEKALSVYFESRLDYFEFFFETMMLKNTQEYYSRKASTWIQEYSFPDYMLEVEKCLKREEDIASRYFPCSMPKLLQEVVQQLLSVRATQLLKNDQFGCHTLLRDGKVDDLSRMYCLFSKANDGLLSLPDIFKKQVTDEGISLVKQAKSKKKDFVEKVLELHDKYLNYANNLFVDLTPLLNKALSDGFEVFCNKGDTGHCLAEGLATFYDNIFRVYSSENAASAEAIEKGLVILDYITERDIFVNFYSKKLIKRLLFYNFAMDQDEVKMFEQLKSKYGSNFAPDFDRLVKDLKLAKQAQSMFEKYFRNNPSQNPGFCFQAGVLNVASWPDFKPADINFPAEVGTCLDVYKEFFCKLIERLDMPNRNLTWVPSLGTCTIEGRFESQTIMLEMTQYQACILLLFNDADGMSYSQISTQSKMPSEDLDKVLQSLTSPNCQILIKDPNTKTVSPTDHYQFNISFTHRMEKIKIPPLSLVDVDKTTDLVDWRHTISAFIMRLLKTKKVLAFSELRDECFKELNLCEDYIIQVKESIENLIKQEYLERDEADSEKIRYIPPKASGLASGG